MTFLNDDVLLDTPQAKRLYHDVAAKQPIVDYHCHLDPALIARDHRFADLSELWLAGDHYKWRALRSNGVSEREITGDAPGRVKFQRWAETLPKCLRNPLFQWSHLELKRVFGIDRVLCPDSAEDIWQEANAKLAQPGFTTRGLMSRFAVEMVGTTDDPADSLEHHRAIAGSGFACRVLPSWRPDRALNIHLGEAWNAYLDRLGTLAGVSIASWQDLLLALERRHQVFHDHGCRISDCGLETVPEAPATEAEATEYVARVRAGGTLTPAEADRYRLRLMEFFAELGHRRNWVQQFHIGALRNPNPWAWKHLGPDTGFDTIADGNYIVPLGRFLGRLAERGVLSRTILYNLNPRDNEALASLCGSFQDGSVPGKIQFGAAWWFLDQLDGMTRNIETLSQLGLLARSVGMLTDSRSVVSYVRHEWFRRLLCRILGRDMRDGLIPDDHALVGGLVADVSYGNAAAWFLQR